MSRTVSTRVYPLLVEWYEDADGPCVFYTKGHAHAPQDFLAAALATMQAKGLGDPGFYTRDIAYRWYRKRPLLPGERLDYGFDFWVEDAEPASRGAFPAMEVYVA